MPYDWKRDALPTLDSRPDDVKAYFQRQINPLSPRRRWVTNRAGLNLWMYHGRQWLEIEGELSAGMGAYNYREVYRHSAATFKRPVTNIIAPAVDNEVSRLTKKDYQPEASASRNKPGWIAAADLAKALVTWEVSRQAWIEKREEAAFNDCVDETVVVRTFWDEAMKDLVPVGALDATVCSACERKYASSLLPAALMDVGLPTPDGPVPFLGRESIEEQPLAGAGEIQSVRARKCPYCGEGELKEYKVSREEVLDGATDALGAPLGRMVPKGDTGIEVVSMHDFYPENGGVGVQPWQCKVWHQQTARAIEDVLQRWPGFEKTIHPDDPQKILQLHPLYSDRGLVAHGMLFGASGMDAYQSHVLVKEVVVAPQPRAGLELGAHFVMVNDELLSRPLCVEVQAENGKELVPKVRYHVARAKRVTGLFWGRGFVSDLVPLQKRLNELDAQVVDIRERGKPNLYIPRGVEMYVRKDQQGSYHLIEYENDGGPMDWSPKDGIAPGVPMTGNPYMAEREQILRDAQLIGTPQDIELGAATGIKTTSGMMLAQEQAGTRREPRERGLVSIYDGISQHVLDMNKVFRKDKGVYEVKSDSGIHEVKEFESQQLVGTIKVKMKVAPGFDQALYDKEATAEAIGMQLYDISNPVDRQQALRNMRLPLTVNEGHQVQIRRAEMAFADFMREGVVPYVDQQLFDPNIWFPIFQRRWLDDECLELQREAEFDAVWARLAGWEDVLAQAEAQDMVLQQLYGSHPQEQWGQIHAQATALYQTAVGKLQAEGVIPAMGPPPPESGLGAPPPPPPEGGFLPKQQELRIYTVWQQMLGPSLEQAELAAEASLVVGVSVNKEAEKVTVLQTLLKMRAVIETFRFMLMALAAPVLAAPAPAGPGGPEAAPSGETGPQGGAPPAA